MSAEEKQKLLSEKDEVAVPSERPTVPVVDYSSKTFYDYLGLKQDASMETIRSTYAELSKKYNPITNPDEIDRYQDIYYSGINLTDSFLKHFYDEYGDISVILYHIFDEYLPFETESAYKYVTMNLMLTAIFLLSLFSGIITIFARTSSFNFKWIYAFLPTIFCTSIYLIYGIARALQDSKKSNCKKDKKDKKENCGCNNGILKNDICNIVLACLLILFQITLGLYLGSEKKCCIILVCLPYIAFEAIILVRDTLKFLKGVEAIKSGKEVDCPLLKDNIFLKYLTGIANAKCSKESEKKNSSCVIGYLFYSIYYLDIFRIVQSILFGIYIYKESTPYYIIYYIPSLLLLFAGITEKMIKSKIGYVNNTKESIINIIKLTVYTFIFLDALIIVISIAINKFSFYSITMPLLFELVVVAGFVIGFFPFVLILEYKGKHDELAVPY